MKSGYHDHWCPKGKHPFICPKVTHCNDEFDTPCPEHREPTVFLVARDGRRLIVDEQGRQIWSVKEPEQLVAGWAEENYLDTGKRPGE